MVAQKKRDEIKIVLIIGLVEEGLTGISTRCNIHA